jgi:predicted Fe-Mo cluster-binding NifX family protein
MLFVIPIWRGRVSPVFDVAQQAVLADTEQVAGGREEFVLGSTDPHERARTLAARGVELLICGAISQPHRAALAGHGIRVFAGICGEVERVIEAWRTGALPQEDLLMPGCRRHCHRGGRGGRGRGRGGGRGRGHGWGRGVPGWN